MQGRCTCGRISYRLTARPLFVHACHCSWCQRETGSAFALNAMIETECVEVSGTPELVMTPSNSGKGQEIARCPTCRTALFSHYAGAGRTIAFVRVGTLDRPADCPPDIHIFTSTKQPWLVLDGAAPVVPEYYDRKLHWPQASLDRLAALRAKG
ncbi:GFA family protein [Rhodobacter ferrooxidans]|uniref:Glutathione-dependent formaldehyde-activating GFA n=1 Tax=Rhodobacter ferrooxidans TaxID=371731 RepID=C8S473_9RHOB|nr:GFA family protein [Rhodobacter sp. SW2]EEW24239.1 glutathione-dependent formaldehyde-activating GFA [Rhodobacter sp. SW2]